ncbi:hypothetical protein F7725_012322 [Dissostichus mawsoni]|uniref:G-protein coupled receptors family 1 profile domain-containing protein n=1 Tax=Dissostichus mawsoni TaxID=36200 RepID=A0A7J5YMF1_DISMA|nr:hypothetical protein F7725_012322 [Dissostichus mawsoni]
MEVLENMFEEGSASPEAFTNASLHGVANITNITNITNIPNITYFPYYQHSLYVAASYILAYFFIFLLCMVGNILVCLIVLENRCMRTVTNLFILNLAISWPFSNCVCKMSGFVQGVSVSASVFTLVAIAGAIVFIWMLAVVIMCPAAVALTAEKVPFHYMVHNNDFNQTFPLYTCYENFAIPQMRKVYTSVLFALIYLVPLTIIMLMYGSIGVKLGSSVIARGGQPLISQKKIKVIKMLIMVALLFMLSWLPLWTLMMMTDYAGFDRDQVELLTSYIFPFAHWLAFSNSSVNPIIYGYYNENFKKGFQAVCKSRPFGCLMQCQLWSRVVRWGRKDQSVQAPGRESDFRDATSNHNRLVLGVRNRVHNVNQLTESAEVDKSLKVGSVVVHSEKSFRSRVRNGGSTK